MMYRKWKAGDYYHSAARNDVAKDQKNMLVQQKNALNTGSTFRFKSEHWITWI